MGAFSSSQVFPVIISNLTPVANDVMEHFKRKGFEVTGEKTLSGWEIDVTKNSTFKGKCTLKVEIEPIGSGTAARASVQARGSALAMFFGPALIAQAWEYVKSTKLDDEALECVRESLTRHSGYSIKATPAQFPVAQKTCASCGEQLKDDVKFCYSCGTKVEGPKACPTCNTQLPALAKFCSSCGTKTA